MVAQMMAIDGSSSRRQRSHVRQDRDAGRERPLRLCMVIPSLSAGVQHNVAFVEALQSLDVAVRVLTAVGPPNDRPDWLRVLPGGAMGRRTRGGVERVSLVWASWRVATELIRLRPDAILCVEYGMTTIWGLIASRIAGARVAIVQEHAYREQRGFRRIRRTLRRALARNVDVVIANTSGAAGYVVDELGVDPARVATLRLLVPPDQSQISRRDVELPPSNGGLRFVFVGRLIPRKNVASLVRAASMIRQRGASFDVVVAGDGPERANLNLLAERLQVIDIVHFVGSIPHDAVGNIYRRCDVFVMPSLWDYRSVAVMEAMRCGKPIIASSLDGNVNDTVRDGVNGFVVNPRDVDQLADAMEAFVQAPSLVEEMGEAARSVWSGADTLESARRLIDTVLSDRPMGEGSR